MVIKVGINGFGRTGRVFMRSCFQNPNLEIAAINDPAITIEYVCYLIKFDSTYGTLEGDIRHVDNDVLIDDKSKIRFFSEKLPERIPWDEVEVQYVVEASGMFTNMEKASGHLKRRTVRRVILTAPSIDIPMVILGVNQDIVSNEDRVISCASSTLYCLAPIIKLLDDNLGIAEGWMTSIHAMTPSLKPLDGLCLKGKHWRDHRSIHQNVIPTTTGACKALSKIIPGVKDKLCGMAFRVPIVNVSVLDLSIRLNSPTNLESIASLVDGASKSHMNNIITVSSHESVSSDFSQNVHSCIFDFNASLQLKPNTYKLICWYANEYAYSCRIIDLIFFSETQLGLDNRNKVTQVRPKLAKKFDSVQTESFQREISIYCNYDPVSKTETISTSTSINKRTQIRLKKRPYVNDPCPKREGSPVKHEKPKVSYEKNNHTDQSSSFLSCEEANSCTQTSCTKAQERLEIIKHEFSKMAIITEDLLKKTQSNVKNIGKVMLMDNPLIKELENERISIADSCGDSFHQSKKQMHDIIPVNNESNGELCEISNKKSDTAVVVNEEAVPIFNIELKDTPHINSCGDIKTPINPLLERDNRQLINNTPSDNDREIIDEIEIHTTVYTPNAQYTNTPDAIETEIDLAKAPELPTNPAPAINTEIITITKPMKRSYSLPDLQKNKVIDTQHNSLDTFRSKEVELVIDNGENSNKGILVSPAKDNKKAANVKKNDKAGSSKHDKIKAELVSLKVSLAKLKIISDKLEDRGHLTNTPINRTKPNIDCMRRNTIFAKIKKKPVDVTSNISEIAERLAQRRKPITALNINNMNYAKPAKDLYDKLESGSEEGSTHSLDMWEKKSQEIKLSDLTSSVENISRLDKICRIIEISDELSDRLFSPLERQESSIKTNKHWSLRDLCQKIKLDEFCNTVFGTSKSL